MASRYLIGPPAAARRGGLLPLLVGATIVLAGASSNANAARLPLTTQPGVPFPVRVYVVSTPGAKVPSVVNVTENGAPVRASLTPVGEERVPFSAAVLLDSSLTMIGKPFVAARTAASALIERKPPRSELALYGFYAQPYLLHDWSSRTKPLIGSLSSLRTRYGTAAWDAVILASERLRARKGSAKAIVILTDGRKDTTKTRPARALAAASRAGARVFVVIAGQSDRAQVARLRMLTGRTGGSLLTVDSIGQLRQAFAQIARTLSRQYLLSYASGQDAPGLPVDVRVEIDGATAQASYTVPATADASSDESFLFSTGGAALLLLLLIGIPLVVLTMIARRSRYRHRAPRSRR